MKIVVFIKLLSILITLPMEAQIVVTDLDSNYDKTLFRSFDNVPQNKYLDSLALSANKIRRYNSVLGCLMQIEFHKHDILFVENLKLRLRDIAQQLIAEEHPTILEYGSDCREYIDEVYLNGNLIHLYHLCYSQSTITFSASKIVEDFNKYTMETLGLIKPEETLSKSKRKRKKE